MAKDDKQDVARAKSAARNKKTRNIIKAASGPKKGAIKAYGTNSTISNFKPTVPLKPGTPKANAAKTSNAKVYTEKMKARQGVMNKMKAQGAKSMGGPTSGYGKSTKPKGK
jgi:hypothetical protein